MATEVTHITIGGVQYPCTVRAKRAAMTDDEFWADVYLTDPYDEDGEIEKCIGIDGATPCPECGSTVACGYDSEGRPMIHVVEDEQ